MALDRLSGKQFAAACDAMAFAFPSYELLDIMLYSELDKTLSEYSNPKAMPLVLSDLLMGAQRQGWLEPLFMAAFKSNPNNPKLRELGPVLLLTGGGAPSARLQGLVMGNNALVDIEEWRAGIERVQKSVARFQVENMKDDNRIKGIATGFLVADDVLLTNCHVVDMLKQKAAAAPAAEFDFVVGGDASEVIALEGDWVLGSSPVNELDYALIKLPRGTGRPVMPTPKPYDFSAGDIYFIVQHPEGDPMKIGGGTMAGFNTAQRRVNYTTNTEPGSSGSPVFTTSWQPVALHCAGSMDETYNMGVPLAAVHADAVAKGIWPGSTA